jgi:CheY-specific phosphatase CheX
MMTEQIRRVMTEVAIKTFEKLAFMFAFSADDDTADDIPDSVSASVRFSGPFSGCVTMRISKGVLPELASNMLGLDDEIDATPDQQFDALKETVNVVCGNLLPGIAGQEPVFTMAMPEVVSRDAVAESGALVSARVEFDEGKCGVELYIDGEIPEGFLRGS